MIRCVDVYLLRVSLLPHVRCELPLVLQQLLLLLLWLLLLLLLEKELTSLNEDRQKNKKEE